MQTQNLRKVEVDGLRRQQLRALMRYLESRQIIWVKAYELECQRYQSVRPPSNATEWLMNTSTRRYGLAVWVLKQLGVKL